MDGRDEELETLKMVRESLQAFHSMVEQISGDLHTMADNYRHYAEVNRRWGELTSQPGAPSADHTAGQQAEVPDADLHEAEA